MIDFLKNYRPKNVEKYTKVRVGSKFDGGYVIMQNIVNYDLFVSCGISDNMDFEDDFLTQYKNVKCLAFDGTISSMPDNHPRITFIRKNIGDKNNDSMTTLKEFIEPYKNVFLKMDIETWEFKWLNSINQNELKKFAQIVIEIHFPFTRSESVFKTRCGVMNVEKKIELMKKLFINHKLFHIHGNSSCGITQIDNKKLPNVLECTLVRNDLISESEIFGITLESPPIYSTFIIRLFGLFPRFHISQRLMYRHVVFLQLHLLKV